MSEVIRRLGDGPALVLLHGAGANAKIWEPLFPQLSAFDLAAVSLPGRGDGATPPEDPGSAAAWLQDALADLGGGPPFVLGHSYGGALAIELALRAVPLAGLILVSTGAKLRVHPGVLAMAEAAARGSTPMSTSHVFIDGEPERVAAYEAACQTTPPPTALADWNACDSFDRMGEIQRIEVPTLVIGGQEDALTPPKYQRYLAEELPRAQLCLVEGCGHMLPWERPARFAAEVRAFVSAC